MLSQVNFDLRRENIWFDIGWDERSYDIRISNVNGDEIILDFGKRQLQELLQKFIDEGLYEVDEDGEVYVKDL